MTTEIQRRSQWNLWWRGPIHGAICAYLRRCSGAFHHNQYGPDGRYVVLMTEEQYHRYGKVRQLPNNNLTDPPAQ